MTDTSVIEASSVGIKTMADGTLRLTVDVEPRNAQAAFRLFGSPGTPMAVAALKPGAQPSTEPGQAGAEVGSEPLKGGAIAKWLAIRCGEPAFQTWLYKTHSASWEMAQRRLLQPDVTTSDYAAEAVRIVCGVRSRRDIDHDTAAKETFERLIRKPWLESQK